MSNLPPPFTPLLEHSISPFRKELIGVQGLAVQVGVSAILILLDVGFIS